MAWGLMLSFVTVLWNSLCCPALAITGGGVVKVSVGAILVYIFYQASDSFLVI